MVRFPKLKLWRFLESKAFSFGDFMSKKQIYYVLWTVAFLFMLFALNVQQFNMPPEFSTIFLMIGVAILMINLAFFKFW
jgi:hypothetical protein